MRFGRWDFAAFMGEIDAGELNGWLDFAEQDPAGWEPLWGPMTGLMSWMAATHPFSPRDIPPKAFLPVRVEATTAADTQTERVAKIKAGGGRVIEPKPLVKYTPKGA